MSRSRVGIWVALAAIVALVGGAVALRGGGRSTPAPLPFGAGGGSESTAPAADVASGAMAPYEHITYAAGVDLPRLGGHARVYEIKPPSDADVLRIARAFGIDGKLDSADGGRLVSGDTATLSVYGVSWTVYESSGGGAVAGGTASSDSCATRVPHVPCPTTLPPEPPTTGSDTTVPTSKPPSTEPETTIPVTTIPQQPEGFPTKAEAVAKAMSVAAAAGFDTSDATTDAVDDTTQWSVTVHLTVDGHAARGLDLNMAIGPGPAVQYASGVAGSPVAVDDYPLIDTRAAVDRLNKDGPFYGSAIRPMAIANDTATSNPAGDVNPSDPTLPSKDVPTTSAQSSCPPNVYCSQPLDGGDTTPPASGVAPPTDPPDGTVPPVTVPPPDEITVTLHDATQRYDVTTSWDGATSYLVPTYAMTGTSSASAPAEVTALAIDGSFLRGPDSTTTIPGTGSTGSGSSGGSTGSGGAGTGTEIPPSDPCAAVEDIGGGSTLTVTVPDCPPTSGTRPDSTTTTNP